MHDRIKIDSGTIVTEPLEVAKTINSYLISVKSDWLGIIRSPNKYTLSLDFLNLSLPRDLLRVLQQLQTQTFVSLYQ